MQNKNVNKYALKFFAACFYVLCVFACVNIDNHDAYKGELKKVTFVLEVESQEIDYTKAEVSIRDINNDAVYNAKCDAKGVAELALPCGVYIAMASISGEEADYSGSRSGVIVSGDASFTIPMHIIKTADILIKEVYCGGCLKYPQEGTYQADSYIILHNNSASEVYLDGLCFGTLDPYNSNSSTVWDIEADYVPIIQAIWQFPGTGSDFPLQSGEDAIIAVRGAIDHSAVYPMSVNLNREDVFTCYNPTYFPNANYHPVPGPLVDPFRYMQVVIKTGQANAYTLSINSPALVIFRAPQGMTMQEFVSVSENVIQKPGSAHDRVVLLPKDCVIDGVEVFNGGSSSNKKRLSSIIDAGFVTLSKTFEGRSLMRKKDDTRSQSRGYEVLVDTNNSSNDFYESEIQSLHN